MESNKTTVYIPALKLIYMRKILIILLAIITASVSSPIFAAKQDATDQMLFERAVNIIKKFETMHKPKHWPLIGYGHYVQPGEPYRRGVQLTEAEADKLLRKDLKKFCSLYSQYGKDAVLLGALAYNCGPGVVSKSGILKQLKNGDRNITKAYTSHCRYKGKTHSKLKTRRLTELDELFIQ